MMERRSRRSAVDLPVRKGLDDGQIVALIEQYESQSLNEDILRDQARAMDYYNLKPFGYEETGRSGVVSSDVFNVVEGMTPIILKPFVSSDDIVKFTPEGPEDEPGAEQESEYVNYLVTQKNDVFETLVAWVKTGLLQKNGVVKYWWEKSRRTRIERYTGLDADVFAALSQENGVEIAEHTETPEGHDVVLRVVDEVGEPKFCVIPPEEFRIARNAINVNPKLAEFVQHRTYKTISALREMGYDIDDHINDESSESPRDSDTYLARREFDYTNSDRETVDPSMREVLYRETYLLADVDGDGIAELRRVCLVGTTILHNEEAEEIPFAAWTPMPQAFSFYGKCPADEVCEIQEVKSSLIRQTMDNIYTINNNRTYVGPNVNVDDLIDNQIGGIVRITAGTVAENIQEARITPINGVTMPMIEYFDSALENRSGWTRYNQGADADSLNKTATGIRLITEAGNERVGLISRSFAETGLKQLMLGVHGLCRRHSDKATVYRLRGKWVPIDPRTWRTRFDMSVSVGLGNSDKQMQMQGAQMLLNEQKQLMQVPGLVTPKNLYESAAKLATAIGEKSPERFFSPPDENPQPPPDPMQDPNMMLQVAESKRKDKELELKERELALKEQEAAVTAQQKQREIDIKEKEANRAGIEAYARLENDLTTPETAMAERAESEALQILVNNQTMMVDNFGQFLTQMAESQALIAEALKPKRQVLKVEKQADGSFVGLKTPVEE
jgi:hypothetical protein